MHPPFLPSQFWFSLILSLILILAPKSGLADDGNISSCSARFSCGDIRDIGYPFWGLDRPESCGYPGFMLSCTEDVPAITIMSATYRVLHISTSSGILQVARSDYYADNICPTRFINSTFNSSLVLSNSQDIRLYYGCQTLTILQNLTPIQARYISNQFECPVNGANIIGYYVTRDITETIFGNLASMINISLGSCNDNVIIPVLNSEIQLLETNRDSGALKEVLNFGFELRWNANDSFCNPCLNSGGQCGHNLTTGEFICYCWDGTYPKDCPTRPPGKKNEVGLPVGLGIAGAAIVGIFLSIGIFRYKQHRRKKIDARVKTRDLPTPPSSKGPPSSTTSLSLSYSSYDPTPKYDIEKGSTYFGAHVFSYEELEEATENFNPSKELGEGGFGTVYFGVLNDGRVVAVKRLYENNFKRVDQYMNEIAILTRIRHPNLVILYGCTSTRSRELLLVYEYIPNGTVADHLHGKFSNSGLLTWPVRLSIAVETANALAYLHATDIIHRDVKTNNILLDKNFHVKVADFGLSRLFPNDVTHVSTAPQGTPGYVDPEYYQCYQLTEKSDVYSFGVVLIELISAKQAVDTNRHRHDINLANMAVNRIQNHALHELVDPSLGFENDNEVKRMITAIAELAFRCLQKKRDVRPSMQEVLDILIEIQNEKVEVQKKAEAFDKISEAEVGDIRSDDVGLLKHVDPLSPNAVTDKWVSSSTISAPNSM